MERNRAEEQGKLLELNQRFLAEVESGAGWNDLRGILEEMKEIAKALDHLPATIISFDNYQLNKESEAAQSSGN